VIHLEEKEYFLAWQIILPGAARRFWYLVERFGSPEKAWHATKRQLSSIGGFTPEGAREIDLRRRVVNPEAEMAWLKKKGIEFVHFGCFDYPELLKAIFDPPPGLFVKGDLSSCNNQAVAVVGARKATGYGLAVAAKLAGELAGAGVTVVSGMARGVDTAAHKGALAAGGRTVAVLGCGVDVVYPRENAKLMAEIAENSVVISEFPLQSQPEAWHFPYRNRIISGLCRGTVIVEAAERSGALITADFALEQGREVMAVPGNITSTLSCGTNRLIKQGARPVENASDILEELGLGRLFKVNSQKTTKIKLSPEEEVVTKVLAGGPATLDQLVEQAGIAPQKVLSALTFLEMKMMVRQLPGKLYVNCGKSGFLK